MKRACSEPDLSGLVRSRPRLSAKDVRDMLDNSDMDEVDLNDYYPESEFCLFALAKTKRLVIK